MQILETEFSPNMMSQILQASLQKLSRTDLTLLIVLLGAIRLELMTTLLFVVEGEQDVVGGDQT